MTGTIARKFSITATYLPEVQSAETPTLGFCVEVHLEETDALCEYVGVLMLVPGGEAYCDVRPIEPARFVSSGAPVERAFVSLGQPTLDAIVSALIRELSAATRTIEPITFAEW